MSPPSDFFESPPFIALIVAIFIFLITILLAAKRWIGFSITLLLLIFCLAAGFGIDYQRTFQSYFDSQPEDSESTHPILTDKDKEEDFHKQILQAIEDLKLEVNSEKENLREIMNQVHEIFNSLDAQKQKLQNFIEETRGQFKTEYPTKSDAQEGKEHPVESSE